MKASKPAKPAQPIVPVPHDRVTVSDPRKRVDRGTWRVEVRCGQHPTLRTFRTLAEARVWRDRLLAAKREGQQFDRNTGEPLGFSALAGGKTITVLAFADKVCTGLMTSLAPGGRKAKVQRIAWAVLALGPELDGAKRSDVYRVLTLRLRGETLTGADLDLSRRLEEASNPITQIDRTRCEAALAAFAKNADGKSDAGPVTIRNRRQGLSHLMAEALARGVIVGNPMPPIERRGHKAKKKPRGAVSAVRIGTPEQVRAILTAAAEQAQDKPQWRADSVAALWTIYATGCRPGEALGLTGPDVQGGLVYFGRSLTQPGTAWSDGEEMHTGPLKWQEEGDVRIVPVAIPEVAEALQARAKLGGRLFPVTGTQLAQVWRDARAAVADGTWPEARLARTYDLRHQFASAALNAGVSVVELAERLGHDPGVTLSTYSATLIKDRDRWTDIIARAL